MRRFGFCARVFLLLWLAGPSLQGAEPLAGRPVAQVLDEAIRAGAKIIYSSERIPPDLRVLREPQAEETLARLREVLAPHGLMLRSTSGGIWVVVHADSPPRANEAAFVSNEPALAPLETAREQVTVTSSRYTLLSPPASPLALGASDIQTQPALLDDALRAIRRFPGTASTPYSSRTHVRGGDDNENVIVLDGVPLTEPYRLRGLPADFSLIDPAIVDKVDFYSGVFPVEYGGRMGSMTHLRTRHATRPFGGRLGLGFVNASALLEGSLPREDGDWLVAMRRGTLDLLARAVDPDFGRPALLDLFASLRLKAGARSAWSFGVLSADDDVSLRETDGSEATAAESSRTQVWLNFESGWEEARFVTRLAYNSSDLERAGFLAEEEVLAGELTDNRNTRALILSQDWRLPLRELTLRWGWSAEEMDVGYDYRRGTDFAPVVIQAFGPPPLPDFAAQFDSGARSLSAYTAVEWSPTDELTMDLGARWQRQDYDTDQNVAGFDPRVSLLYRFGPRMRGRLAWGRLTQFASGAELPVERALSRYDDPARAALWVLGFDYELARDQVLRVELYEKRIQHPWARLESLLDPLVLVPELRPDQVLIAPRSAHASGIDIHWFGHLNQHWRGWVSYSGSHAVERFAEGSMPRSWDQRHALSAGISTERWGWNWTVATTVHSGWPTTAVSVSPGGAVTLGPRNGARLPWYGTLDLKAQRGFELRQGMLRFSAELTNATGRANLCCSTLDFEDDPGAPLLVKVEKKSWLPLVPLLNVAWEF